MNWYLENGKESDVVIYSKVELARNLKKYPFSKKMTLQQRNSLLENMKYITPSLGYGLKYFSLQDMDDVTKISLVERKLLTYDIARQKEPLSIIMNDDENICIIVGGENHINIQVFQAGLDLSNIMNLAIEIDEKLDSQLLFSCNEKYGYLTASPMNCGTGLKASTIVHLPALKATNNLGKIMNIIHNFGMIVTNEYDEDIEGKENIYKISNHQTIGITEQDIIKSVENITKKVIEQERNIRKYLGKNEIELEDKVYRSFGILTNAKKLTVKETEELLSDVKLGTDLGIISELNDVKVKKMMLYTKDANLLKRIGKLSNQLETDIKRAEIIKQIAYSE